MISGKGRTKLHAPANAQTWLNKGKHRESHIKTKGINLTLIIKYFRRLGGYVSGVSADLGARAPVKF